VLIVIQIPEHSLGVLATRSAERTIWGDSDGVEISSVSVMVSLQLAVCQAPYLNSLVPTTGYNDGITV